MTLFERIVLFSCLPVITMIGGGIIAIIRKPSGNVRSFILHFAAGVVFSVVAVELLPDVVKTHAPVPLIIGFTAGFVLMIWIRSLAEKKMDEEAEKQPEGLPLALLLAVGVNIFIDGLLLGIAFTAGRKKEYYWQLHWHWNCFHWAWRPPPNSERPTSASGNPPV